MTICISAICERDSSVVLATDAMITNRALSIEFEHQTKKMTHLTDNCIALTAGDALAHTELFHSVDSAIESLRAPAVPQIVDTIKTCYQKIRRKEMIEKILKPWGFDSIEEFYQAQKFLDSQATSALQFRIDNYDYGLEILVSGVDKGVGHIYGIFDPGTSKCYDSIGWHAIGSGLPHAVNTLIARGCNQDISTAEALIIIYEAKKMAEKAPGVGKNITDIAILNTKGIHEFNRNKISDLDEIHDKWLKGDEGWATDLEKIIKEIKAMTK